VGQLDPAIFSVTVAISKRRRLRKGWVMGLQIPIHDCYAPKLGVYAKLLEEPPLGNSPDVEFLEKKCVAFLLEEEGETVRYQFPQGNHLMILMVRKNDSRKLILRRGPDLDMKLIVLQHHTVPLYLFLTESIVSSVHHELELHMGVLINGRDVIHFHPFPIHTFISVC